MSSTHCESFRQFILLFSLSCKIFSQFLLIGLLFLSGESNGQLLLTPYIQAGLTKEARDVSRVDNLSTNFNIESYSGFIAINEEFNSNIFFWYFPPIVRCKSSNKPFDSMGSIWLKYFFGIV